MAGNRRPSIAHTPHPNHPSDTPSDGVRVYVRVRPGLNGEVTCVEGHEDMESVVVTNIEKGEGESEGTKKKGKRGKKGKNIHAITCNVGVYDPRQFQFDDVFGPTATQKQ
ncbi:hypothetical protein KIPB_006147, partial [Kipferlia bialata]|eukprot:g6147.t1